MYVSKYVCMYVCVRIYIDIYIYIGPCLLEFGQRLSSNWPVCDVAASAHPGEEAPTAVSGLDRTISRGSA
jgi:hypothetical protein